MNKSTLITAGIAVGTFTIGLFCGEKSLVNRIRHFYRNADLEEAMNTASQELFKLDEIIQGFVYPDLCTSHVDKYHEILSEYIEYAADFEALQVRVELFKIGATDAIAEFDTITADIEMILWDLSEYLDDANEENNSGAEESDEEEKKES